MILLGMLFLALCTLHITSLFIITNILCIRRK